MPEARDRLSSAENVAEVYARRRRAILAAAGSNRGAGFRILADEQEDLVPTTPFRWGSTPMTGRVTGFGGGGGSGRGFIGTPRVSRGRSHLRSPGYGIVRGGENMTTPASSSTRGRGRRPVGSALPSWYPRRPLQDITAIMKAIERRRASLREGEGLQLESPRPQDQNGDDRDPSASSGAQLEHETSKSSAFPTVGIKKHLISVGKVPKLLLDITSQNTGESASLTPQKKLLNSIDAVERVVMEELHKLQRTPSAKKAERERKVRTLMSMR